METIESLRERIIQLERENESLRDGLDDYKAMKDIDILHVLLREKIRMAMLPVKAMRHFEEIYQPLVQAARNCGYALAVHGSLARDIDLVAVPWTDEAKPVEEFIERIKDAMLARDILFVEKLKDNPVSRPHGRLAWAFHLGGGPYIDLSVMPRLGK